MLPLKVECVLGGGECRRGSNDPRMFIDCIGNKWSDKTNEYYNESNNNNNKLVERCNTTQNEECSDCFLITPCLCVCLMNVGL